MMAKILRKNRDRGWWGGALLAVFLLSPLAWAGSGTVSDRTLREALLQISETESPNYPLALEKLTTAPRAQVLALLREDLGEAPLVRRATVDAIVTLRARELLPELKAVAKQTEFYWFFTGLNSLVGDDKESARELAPVYVTRLGNLLSETAKLAVLNGLSSFHVELPPVVFNQLLESPNYDLRIAMVRHWRATRDLLSEAERQRRLERLAEMQPRQARVLAWREIPRLPAAERAPLRKSLTRERCDREIEMRAREACRKAEQSLRGRP